MDQLKLTMLLDSYGFDKLLENSDVLPEKALEVLILEGLIDLDDYFNVDGELDE
jgi:hypothetical protein